MKLKGFPQFSARVSGGKVKEETAQVQDLQLLRPEEVARILKVAKVTPYQWARKGILPCYRLEGTIRFKLGDIKEFVEGRRIEKRR